MQYVYIYYHVYNSWNRPIGTFPTLIIKLHVLQELFPIKTQIFNKNNVFFPIIVSNLDQGEVYNIM